jgi:cytochrome d ubiquinol oxidase subunit II
MNILALTWGGIIAFGVILYIILDGFDLGIGMLSLFFKSEHDRDIMISTILPVWDGNETWLVFGGAALYGGFPLAFSIILPAIYIPIFIMVVALLFRGVAFEFRLKATEHKFFWDICFFCGSLITTITQGLILGTFVQGFKLSDGSATLDFYQWFNPFGVACALALIFGYGWLGANHLIAKTTGALQAKCFAISGKLQYLIVFFVVMVSVWSPLLDPAISARWFDLRLMPYLALLPLLTAVFLALHWRAIKKRYEYQPFWLSIGVFVWCYAGFIISSYPYIVPRSITYIQAAASASSLKFMLIGAAIMLPPLLYYTYYSYKIFAGKVTEHIEY